jgi:hypothetical protein
MTYAPQSRAGTNGMAVAGLVCGIVGVFLFSIILGPLAIVFGSLGMHRSAGSQGMARAAIILGIVDLVIFAVMVIVAVNNNGSFYWHVG